MKKTILPFLCLLALSCNSNLFAAKSVFERSKPHVNVGTLGHADHGKSTLAAALAAASGTRLQSVLLYPDDGDATHDTSLKAFLADIETDAARYSIYDFDEQDTIENMLLGGVIQDGAILVVSAADGPMPQTREHVLLARQVGVPVIVVFLNLDGVLDSEQIDRAETQVHTLLHEAGYDTDKTRVVRGSASGALRGDDEGLLSLAELTNALDESVATP